jgi:hypothetical protein
MKGKIPLRKTERATHVDLPGIYAPEDDNSDIK